MVKFRGAYLELRDSDLDKFGGREVVAREAEGAHALPARARVLARRALLPGYHSDKKPSPPKDHQRSLGIGLLKGPTGGGGLMSKAPLQPK